MKTLIADRSRGLRPLLLLCALTAFGVMPAGAANITILNNNAPGVGFNDPSPRAPVGGNPGTTLGAQRLFIFQHAADIWSGILPSGVTIVVRATFAAQTCTPTSAVLGSAGTTTIHRDFVGAPFAGTWYNQALANKLFGSDLSAAQPDINATFNLSIDSGCFGPGLVWYYGIDGLEGNNIELLPVVLHEIGHGLGFQTFTSGSSGAYNGGFPSIADRFLFDTVNGLHWNENTAAQRVASAISIDKLAWDGAAVNKEAVDFLGPRPVLQINSPAGIAGVYPIQTASFGAPVTLAGLTGNVVLGVDGVAPVNDGCEPLINAAAVAGNIVLLDRGLCTFVIKAQQAQAAGAVGLLVANNVAAGLPGMGGTDPSITIPCVGITQAEGNAIKANLAGGVNVTIHLDPSLKAGMDNNGRVLMYAPNPFASGSSVSHYDVSLSPNALMEPAINPDLHTNLDLTPFHFRDLGWFPTTTLSLAASTTTVACDDTLKLTATVSPAGGAKGNVEFFESGNPIGLVPVVNNTTATLSLPGLAAGSYSFTSSYSCFTCSTSTLSGKVSVAVDATPIPTTTTLVAEPSPSGCGQDVTFSATIDPPPGGGTVNFFADGNPIGSSPVTGATATVTVSTLAVGVHSITATFKGFDCFTSSTSAPVEHEVVPNAIAVALSSNLNPSTCGVKVTFTARLVEPLPPGLARTARNSTSSGPASYLYSPPDPTGTVNFFDGGNPIGSSPVVDSVATLSVPNLTVGQHSITAVYKGDTCYASATSDKLVQNVDPALTTITLTSAPSPSVCGEKVTLTATVDPSVASGTVTFYDNLNPIGTGTLANGVATLSVTNFTTGVHSLLAEYGGDNCYAGSISDKVFQTVGPAPTTTTLASDPNPSFCGHKVTLTATVAPATATGQVNFFDGGAPIGSGTLTNGVAELSITTLSPGPHSITARYKGDDCYLPSESNKIDQVVNPAATTTTLTGGPNPSTCGAKVTFTATVAPSAATGQVNFFDGGTPIGSGTLVNGQAELSITTLSAGPHSITATYKGDACYSPSGSNTVDQVVGPNPTATTLASDPNPSSCGAKVTFTATVAPATASGEVNFFDGAVQIGHGMLANGVATLSITTLSPGPHSITAVYKGDPCHASSTSNKIDQVVQSVSTSITLSSSPNPSVCNDKVTLTARVEPIAATGQVNFFDNTVPVGSSTLVNGVATLSITTMTEGTHSFTAIYKGDACHASSNSNKVLHLHGCPTATLLSLFQADPLASGVELRWEFGDPGRFVETWIERSTTSQGPWSAVAVERRDEGGVAVAVDRTAETGRTYWYQLMARPEVGAPLQFGPLSVTAGTPVERFELTSVWPNPGKRDFRIGFAVPRSADVRLSVIDIQGREIALLANGQHTPGRYQAVWSGETTRGLVPVGMYFIRYQVPGQVLIGRLVLAR